MYKTNETTMELYRDRDSWQLNNFVFLIFSKQELINQKDFVRKVLRCRARLTRQEYVWHETIFFHCTEMAYVL